MKKIRSVIVSVFLIIMIMAITCESALAFIVNPNIINSKTVEGGTIESKETSNQDDKKEIPPYQVYKANVLINGLSENHFSVYNTVLNPNRKLIFHLLAEGAMEETGLYYASGLWTTYFDDVFKNHPQYAYESILMSYLEYDAESSQIKNTMAGNVTALGVDVLSELCGSALKGKIKDNTNALRIKNQIIALPEEEAKKVFAETIRLEISKGVLDAVSEYESTAEFISNLSELTSADQKHKGQIAFLKKTANGISDNDSLKKAINDIVYSYENQDFMSLKGHSGKQNAYDIGKTAVSLGWNEVLDAVKKADPDIALVLEAMKWGGKGLNVLFGTTTRSQELMSILTLYIIDAELKKSVISLKDSFVDNPNEENAIAFNYAFDSYLEYQNYANSVAKQYINDIINGGVITKTIQKIFSKESVKNAEGLISSCDNEIAIQNSMQKQTDEYFNAYCKTYGLNTYTEVFDELGNIVSLSDSYKPVINDMLYDYGNLRLYHNDDGWWEADGLCYLNLIDFTKDGKEELVIVAKYETNEHYSCYIYTTGKEDVLAEQIYHNDNIELDYFGYAHLFSLSYTDDTGFIIQTGRDYSDLNDLIVYGYNGNDFSPVYDYYSFWEDGEEKVIRNNIVVDIYDDNHFDQFNQNLSMSVTLRTSYYKTIEEIPFDMSELQEAIKEVLKTLNYSDDFINGPIPGYTDAASYTDKTASEMAEILGLSAPVEDSDVYKFLYNGKDYNDENTTVLECSTPDLDEPGLWNLYIIDDPSITVSGVRLGMEKEKIEDTIDNKLWKYDGEYEFDEYSSEISYLPVHDNGKILDIRIEDGEVAEISYVVLPSGGE